ncbi:hypothetical protein N9B73_09910 [Verrucomicrobiales bacterium]|jgi:hypothetical protein|nr:hypothetical protein [Verrucomicrobiales bacterium]
MPSESQWNAILNASLRIHRSSSVVEAGEEALYALKEVLSTDQIELTHNEAHPSEPHSEPLSLQRSVDAGPELFLHFKANYSDPISEVETKCFDVIVKHVICASQRLPNSKRESLPLSLSTNEMK